MHISAKIALLVLDSESLNIVGQYFNKIGLLLIKKHYGSILLLVAAAKES
jgi:hypothetical protein